MDQEVMQQVYHRAVYIFYIVSTKTEDFDRTKRSYPMLVQYSDVTKDF